jgi:hypothetical protein
MSEEASPVTTHTIVKAADEHLPVAIGVVSRGAIGIGCFMSLMTVHTTKLVQHVWAEGCHGYLDDGRNSVTDHFMRLMPECTHLLMVDDDIEFSPDDVRMLYADDQPVVTGVYHSQFPEGICPVIYGAYMDDQDRKRMGLVSGWGDGWPWYPNHAEPPEEDLDPLIQIGGCGAGFLMLRRDALEQLATTYGSPLPYFDEPVVEGLHWGEDFGLCLRLADLGIPIYADRRVQVAHHKVTRLGGR